MCIFNKKDKEKIAILESENRALVERLNLLEDSVNLLRTILVATRADLYDHLTMDKDLEIGDDESEWDIK